MNFDSFISKPKQKMKNKGWIQRGTIDNNKRGIMRMVWHKEIKNRLLEMLEGKKSRKSVFKSKNKMLLIKNQTKWEIINNKSLQNNPTSQMKTINKETFKINLKINNLRISNRYNRILQNLEGNQDMKKFLEYQRNL